MVVMIGITPRAISWPVICLYSNVSAAQSSVVEHPGAGLLLIETLFVPIMMAAIMGFWVDSPYCTWLATHFMVRPLSATLPSAIHLPWLNVESLKAFMSAAFALPMTSCARGVQCLPSIVMLFPNVVTRYVFQPGLVFQCACNDLRLSMISWVNSAQ